MILSIERSPRPGCGLVGWDPMNTFRHLPMLARFVVAAVILGGGTLLLLSFARGAFLHPSLLCSLILLSIGVHTFKVEVPVGRSSHTLSVGYAVSFASLLMLGPGAATWVTMAGGWAECTFRMKSRGPWYQTAFAMSCLSLSMEAAARTLAWTGGQGLVGPADVAIRSLVASALVYFLINSFLIA